MNRRELLQTAAGMLAASGSATFAADAPAPAPQAKLKIDAYSRHLQWLRSAEEVAQACIEMAFDGVDITVRKYPGHVDPEKVKTDLPAFVNTIRSLGLIVDTITTNISDADSPDAEAILDAASSLGIHHYWWGTYRYDLTKPIQPQIEALKPRVARLSKLNEKYGMKAMYHNYSGGRTVGDSIFDFLQVLQNFDPRWVSFHYDTGHATEGGANGTWSLGMRAAGPYIGGMSFKDSLLKLDRNFPEGGPFTGTPAQLAVARRPPSGPGGGPPPDFNGLPPGTVPPPPPRAPAGLPGPGGRRAPMGAGGGGQTNPWRVEQVPLGSGLVDLPQVAQIMKEINFQGPVEVQAEYPNGGAGNGLDKITLPREQVLGAMKHDLLVLRAVLGPAGLI
ncbi:MAG TPA: TIM barrel protein [Rhizomicrobium sp.]|nr:TIM barrel protein [Rhizomicrobium sp.]